MSDFVSGLLSAIQRLRHGRLAQPVIDLWLAEVDPPLDPNDAQIDDFVGFLDENATRWNRLHDRLDPASQQILTSVLLLRALGCGRVTHPWVSEDGIRAAYDAARRAQTGPSGFAAPPYPLHAYALDYLDEPIRLEAWLGNIVPQYRHRDVAIRPGDRVVDAGACFGDTALAFAAETGATGKVISYEPSPGNAAILRHNLALNPELAGRVTVIERALSERPGTAMPFSAAGPASKIEPEGALDATTDSIDAMVSRLGLDRIDFIKMDIEFHEAQALRGAAGTIARWKPKLAIAAYHRRDDLLSLSELIGKLDPRYEFRLGHITYNQSETVLFAR